MWHMLKIYKKLLPTLMLLICAVTLTSSCALSDEDKLVKDAKDSFDISESKAECFVTAVINRTGWEATKVWNVLKDADGPYFDSEEERLWNAMESGFRSCGINPN